MPQFDALLDTPGAFFGALNDVLSPRGAAAVADFPGHASGGEAQYLAPGMHMLAICCCLLVKYVA